LVAQNNGQNGEGGGNNSGGNSTNIWEPDLVELWIYWHKQQYHAFQRFNHNEDTLQMKQNQDFQDKMEDLRKVDEILFNQYQDNDIPKIPFLLPDAGYAVDLSVNLLEISGKTVSMLNEKPFDGQLLGFYIESTVRTSIRIASLVQATIKALNGWEKENLRDNDFRENLVDYIIKELESIVGEQNMLYKRLETGKHVSLLKSK
jgi:hypothetical protein